MITKKRAAYSACAMLLIGSAAILGMYLFLGPGKSSPSMIHELNSTTSTYKETLLQKNFQPIDENTSDETMKNIMLERMFPNYQSNYRYEENQLFAGSPAIDLEGEYKTNSENKKIFIFTKDKFNEQGKELKNACIKALEEEVSDSVNPLYKLAEWCTVPVVKQVLVRHDFSLNETDEDWKQIINSNWFKFNREDKQSFFTSEEYKKIKNSSTAEKEKIEIIKNKCNSALNKPFERKNFPAPKSFLGDSEKADEFQEAALFCTKPKTAKEYVESSMKGEIRTELSENLKSDFCYSENQNDISYYEKIKTTDPMTGKTFWCAVRMIYHKNKETE